MNIKKLILKHFSFLSKLGFKRKDSIYLPDGCICYFNNRLEITINYYLGVSRELLDSGYQFSVETLIEESFYQFEVLITMYGIKKDIKDYIEDDDRLRYIKDNILLNNKIKTQEDGDILLSKFAEMLKSIISSL